MSLKKSAQEIAERIKKSEERREKEVSRIIGKKEDFVKEVKEKEAKSMVGVDGGLLTSRLHGFDLVIARAVSVHYDLNKDLKAKYFPSSNPSPQLFHISTDDDVDAHLFASIKRQKMEVETLLSSIRKTNPELALIDGTIAPYPRKPEKGLYSRKVYEKLIESLKSLFEVSESNNCLLAGVTKDSRSRRFSKLFGSDFPDTVLLFDVLKVGERTNVMPLTENPESHAVYKDLGKWAGMINFFYLKCAEYDRPVRIDFLGEPELADDIAGIILSQSKFSKNYGYPTILIEADQRAKLKEDDSELVYNLITHNVGFCPITMKLRRDSRPY